MERIQNFRTYSEKSFQKQTCCLNKPFPISINFHFPVKTVLSKKPTPLYPVPDHLPVSCFAGLYIRADELLCFPPARLLGFTQCFPHAILASYTVKLG